MAALRVMICTYNRVCVNGIDSTNSAGSRYVCPVVHASTRSGARIIGGERRFDAAELLLERREIGGPEPDIVIRIDEPRSRIAKLVLLRDYPRRLG